MRTETGCRPDQLFGVWAIDPRLLEGMVEAARTVDLAAVRAAAGDSAGGPGRPYDIMPGGLALVPLAGPLTKYPTSFQSVLGGSSTLLARDAVRQAARDPQVRGILLKIDSPGGTVAGTGDLADAVKAAGSRKPVHAYIEDMGGSSAYWIASQASRVSVNPSGWVGAIGCFARLEDTSGARAAAGVKVHVISSGGVKGAASDGAPITEEALADAQRVVDEMTAQFTSSVARGRKLPVARVRELADGRLHASAQAQGLGLIDAVGSLDDALKALVRSTMSEDNTAAALALAEEQQARAVRAEQELAQVRAELAAATATPVDPLAGLPAEARALVEKERADADAARALAARLQAEARSREFQVLASEFKHLPVKADDFGRVLQAASGTLSAEHYGELVRVLRASDELAGKGQLFSELGTSRGSAAAGTGLDEIETSAAALVQAGTFPTREQAIAHVVKTNPALAKRYKAERKGAN